MAKKQSSWYPVSTVGLVCTALYALVPPYMVYAQSTDIFPEVLRLPLVGSMALILGCMLICRDSPPATPFMTGDWHAKRQSYPSAVGDEGLEQGAESSGEVGYCHTGDAKSGAFSFDDGPFDADMAALIHSKRR